MTAEKLIALQAIRNTAGYEALLDLMEDLCNKGENELLAIHPNNTELVAAQHAIAFTQRHFFQDFQSLVNQLIADSTKSPAKDNRQLERERVRRIQSPLD